METGYKHACGVVLWGWLMRTGTWQVLCKGKKQQKMLSTASPLLLALPHLLWAGYMASVSFKCQLLGLSGALQDSLASRNIQTLPSDLKKPHTRMSFRLAAGTFCHTGLLCLWKPLVFFPLVSPWMWLKGENVAETEERGFLKPGLVLESRNSGILILLSPVPWLNRRGQCCPNKWPRSKYQGVQ